MLKIRLIPQLLVKNGRCVKGKRFAQFRDVGNPVTNARIYDAQGADELLILNIDPQCKPEFLKSIQEVSDQCFMPLGIGGQIHCFEDVSELMKKGADKISLNTFAVRRPKLITQIAEAYGAQAVVVSIDAKKIGGKYEVFTENASKPTGLEAVAWAKKAESLGAGEILVTSFDQEGTMAGYDLELIKLIAQAVSIPVIASGGAGKLTDFVDAVKEGKASAVAAGSLLNFTDQSIIKVRKFMKESGVNVRYMA